MTASYKNILAIPKGRVLKPYSYLLEIELAELWYLKVYNIKIIYFDQVCFLFSLFVD